LKLKIKTEEVKQIFLYNGFLFEKLRTIISWRLVAKERHDTHCNFYCNTEMSVVAPAKVIRPF